MTDEGMPEYGSQAALALNHGGDWIVFAAEKFQGCDVQRGALQDVSELLTVGIQGKSAMEKSEAKIKRLSGMRLRQSRIAGSPVQRREKEATILIARRLRELRILRGMTLVQLAEVIGVSYQAFQKYENGASEITAARLMAIADALVVPIGYFVDGQDETAPYSELRTDILRLAGKLRQIEQHTPESFRNLRGIINALAKDKE